MRPYFFGWLFLLLLNVLTANPSLLADEIKVAVAANFTPTLEKIATAFYQKSGHRLLISSGSTGKHTSQILLGAPFDVLLAADVTHPKELVEKGLGIATSRRSYAVGRLMLWSNNTPIHQADILWTDNYRYLAVANPRVSPYGKAAQEALAHLGLTEHTVTRLVQADNIAQTFQFVYTGAADLGLIAQAQWVRLQPEHPGWLVPADTHTPIEQQMLVLTNLPAAAEFAEFMTSEWVQRLITQDGYDLPHPQERSS